ncbi:uncharacterized protein FTJAE_3051 [Fusarium tjaetaba]|uniref:Uncharacterized protein n=1 Tax=Fusarium tjaetaba TaxID=1567544 RepID=A0A8H5S1I5_9HYPO|nr:uncharacterized protein FTJAE_3051 [Fusarium tjaetaba]KAF5643752.1 hypothetical protein FTJAE_3051 [Fusarium tjaetaba]
MAPHDPGFANGDLEKLKSHLLELQLAYDEVPAQRPEGRVAKHPKTTSAPLSDTKEAIIEKVDSDMKAIANSVFTQREDSNLRLPPSKVSTDLYDKLKEICDSDRTCTQEDIDQIDSLLKRFVRQLDPSYPFPAEPQNDSVKGGKMDVEAANQSINDDAHGGLGTGDDGVRGSDSQDESMGGSEEPMEDGE